MQYSKGGNKHENYEILNLIGYGLAKFDISFVQQFGFTTKQSFFEYIVTTGVAETVGTVKNRQDLFDPFFDNPRKGWWQKGNTYIHRKIFIDSLFGLEDVHSYARIVKLYLQDKFSIKQQDTETISPIVKSKFRQLQATGQAAELFFLANYKSINTFQDAILQDARTFGDGYDFQVDVNQQFFLAEIKGIRTNYGSVRLTKNEFLKAEEYKQDYVLVVISELEDIPKMNTIFNPTENLSFTRQVVKQEQITFNSESLKW